MIRHMSLHHCILTLSACLMPAFCSAATATASSDTTATRLATASGPHADRGDGTFTNPVLFADVPDPDIIRVGDSFYMVSTTMHMSPGCTLMKSKDLVNWQVLGYAHDQLGELDPFALKNGQSLYAGSSWAANLRYDPYEGRFYLIVTCNYTQLSYIFTTTDIEHGHWHRNTVSLCYDAGLMFVDEGNRMRKFVVYPEYSLQKHQVMMREINSNGRGELVLTPEDAIIPYGNLDNPATGLRAEGAHGYKIGDYYYIFMIQGSTRGRQEIVWRSKSLEPGSFEGREVFLGDLVNADGSINRFSGALAQGGIVDTPDGQWYCFLMHDYGSVGRLPSIIPMTWDEDGWPVIGNGGLSANVVNTKPIQGTPLVEGIVASDEFDNGTSRYYPSDTYDSDEVVAGLSVKELRRLESRGLLTDSLVAVNEYAFNGSYLKVNWQWNHNPNNNLWSLTDRKGYLRLKSGLLAHTIRDARNTLTQRTFGPSSSAQTALETSLMQDGDVAGLSAYQNQYGFVGVERRDRQCYLTMRKARHKDDAEGEEYFSMPLSQERVYLRVDCDFTDRTDKARFYYSLDGQEWTHVGSELQMAYDWPDFVGQRFALFYYSTQQRGGAADFDYFHVSPDIIPF